MAKLKKRIFAAIIFLVFIAYFFAAARPIRRETVLAAKWISSVDTGNVSYLNGRYTQNAYLQNDYIPFTLGSNFGYINSSGEFLFNSVKDNHIALSADMWTEFQSEPSVIEIKSASGGTIAEIDGARGYPILLDGRIFVVGSDQDVLSEVSTGGAVLWTHEFGAPLTCIDAAAGLVVTGSIDGVIVILGQQGERIFYFEPGGSDYEVILGVAFSHNGSRIGIISGIYPQRFLLLERPGISGGEYNVVYHENLDSPQSAAPGGGFRRPVHIGFIDEDRRVVFERQGGIGCFNIRSRRSMFFPLEGEVTSIDYSGDQGILFLTMSVRAQYNILGKKQELIGIRIPQDRRFYFFESDNPNDLIFLKAHFFSNDVFLGRTESRDTDSLLLVVGGGSSLVSFELEKK